MLQFQQPPREYSNVYLEDTDRPLPEVLNPNTRYMFIGTVATGGKSIIRSCKDLHLSRVVVYKSLRPEFINDPIEQRRLLREARVSALLQHPNTVPTYEIGRDRDGNCYFTMKLVHGYTLREIMNYRDRYDLTQLVEVIEQIAHALDYAHAHGVAHRDIKPENILVGPYGEVLLLDWGMAKVWRKDGTSDEELDESSLKPLNSRINKENKSMTGMGNLQGTLCYMSPEQIRRDPDISYSTDIYSLGSVLYELLAGRTPFTGTHSYEVLEAVEHHQPAKPSSVSKYPVPRLLERLALQCLQKDPAQRPEAMVDVIRVLQENWATDLLAHRR
ncbi:serine/threonine protein kinase [Ketobacter sp.]|uniref:serine/threonine protein kinase n=1 Tax=Ketobacter sp. TaxID=2083498 RepID=UPI000F2DB4D4|nr:serine/threonine-protein kinase [Ketobacter sp.]RLU01847.1 MAG: serine/threonine protein kinase [Ketobacter sp.]